MSCTEMIQSSELLQDGAHQKSKLFLFLQILLGNTGISTDLLQLGISASNLSFF